MVRLVERYNKVVKHKSHKNPAQVKERQDFVDSLCKLFDIASAQAENDIMKNRLLGSKEKEEDLRFLEDQRGPRIASMASKDACFENEI